MQVLLPLLILFGPACPPKTYVVDGEELTYESASERLYTSAKTAVEQDRHDVAVQKLRDYAARFPSGEHIEEVRWLLVESHQALGNEEDERRALEVFLESHPRSSRAPEARLRLGMSYYRSGSLEEARGLLGLAFDEASGETRLEIARVLAEMALQAEDWPRAVEWIGEIRRLARDEEARAAADAELLELIDRKVPQAGLAMLRQDLPSGSPALPMVVMKIARIHFHQREYGPAREALETYLSRWPQGVFAEDAREIHERLLKLSEVEPRVVGLLLPLSGPRPSEKRSCGA
ncbi:MAG: tetratricopeptide repeat protein [Myxococcota bacterium]